MSSVILKVWIGVLRQARSEFSPSPGLSVRCSGFGLEKRVAANQGGFPAEAACSHSHIPDLIIR